MEEGKVVYLNKNTIEYLAADVDISAIFFQLVPTLQNEHFIHLIGLFIIICIWFSSSEEQLPFRRRAAHAVIGRRINGVNLKCFSYAADERIDVLVIDD